MVGLLGNGDGVIVLFENLVASVLLFDVELSVED
jgi:hypothetical protein